MAITAQSLSYQGAAPVAGGSTTLAFGGSSNQELSYIGVATFTLDGAATSATLNFIDGTASLGFTPTAVLLNVCGGTQGAAAYIGAIADTPANGVSTVVRFSGAGTNTNTLKVAVFVLK